MFARSASAIFALTYLAQSALGTVYVNSPVSGDTWAAGQNWTVSWLDDGNKPSLADFGDAEVAIYVGTETAQTSVQTIVASVNVASTASIVFTPDPAAGPDGEYYFIRFQSLSAKDPNNTAYPAEAFSALFTLTDMTGTFSTAIWDQINGTTPASSSVASSSNGPTSTSIGSASSVGSVGSSAPASTASGMVKSSSGSESSVATSSSSSSSSSSEPSTTAVGQSSTSGSSTSGAAGMHVGNGLMMGALGMLAAAVLL
ncbi:uncharacterized protein LAESUDRAFT_727469 [Laetiporus sulphureus 93-53]|uniref:Yeast cell wall synthesis Kre9/Knh1-like N-terminal domain-containing protein n=1 Tax=Laetiporus sulphureus 93-53 TaxID=1314785 RepID=A0A165DHL0_9APHY|nr:uncharacterized protein LAESUDRAFT_727469 [Laetiporus sulphureus 93-53]KZT04895.1 hypothetical protein LAESUDRAFT_727469 [Laetiporus sulphureus 93-53]